MSQFTFNISLSVLNHLGRNLYRSFITVLGEAISNSWDADAKNVWITINREENYMLIKDDGTGMNSTDFQDKFLKIGYSKRRESKATTVGSRPFIGRKGIGKLALLSCAERITILTKTKTTSYVGGLVDNSELDNAIKEDLIPEQYPLGDASENRFVNFTKDHEHGTIIFFEGIKEGIKNTEDYLKKMIALHFRFSLLDNDFTIHFNGNPITIDNLEDLASKTQFLWVINSFGDPFINTKLLPNPNIKQSRKLTSPIAIKGFIATVSKPSDLKITSTEERVSIDLYVNGRLREKDLLRYISSSRVVENYLYGQIHFDVLDDEIDRFTSSREGIVSDDPLFEKLLNEAKTILSKIIDDWDKWRIENRNDGDPDNARITKRERKSRELFNVISDDFLPSAGTSERDKVSNWVNNLGDDAQFNFSSYGECFISENLLRNYIKDRNIKLSPEAAREIEKMRGKESTNKSSANISIELRKNGNDLSYLSMDDLANLVDKVDPAKEAGLSRDAKEYKPVRDAMAHTALLTISAKNKLNSTYENIKARVKTLLSTPK
jgi:hypothetical protein